MNKIFEKFCEVFENKQCIFVKRQPNAYDIHVVVLDEKCDSWKQLKRLNELLILKNLTGCWHNLFATSGSLVKKGYPSKFIFRSKKIHG